MCSNRLKVFVKYLSISLLLCTDIGIQCQNATDDYVYDYPSSVSTTEPDNKARDDYVYDYSPGVENTTVEAKPTASANNTTVTDDFVYDYESSADNRTAITEISRSSDVKDDYVYDYVSSAPENSSEATVSKNTTGVSDDYVYDYEAKSSTDGHKTNETDIKDDYVYDYPSGAPENSSEASADQKEGSESSTESNDSSEDKDIEDERQSGPTSTTISSDEDLGYDDDSESECDEGTLPKLIRLHEENRNLTQDYKIRHVPHVNHTLERIQYVRRLYEQYFGLPKGFGTQMLAFISSIDIVLTPECFASLFSLISGYRNNRKWANKCESSAVAVALSFKAELTLQLKNFLVMNHECLRKVHQLSFTMASFAQLFPLISFRLLNSKTLS